MADVVEVLDLLDLALARSEGSLPAEVHDDLVARAKRIRVRDGFIGEALQTLDRDDEARDAFRRCRELAAEDGAWARSSEPWVVMCRDLLNETDSQDG